MIYLAGTDFSHLTTDGLIKGIKALKLPDYIRSKAYGIDVRETLAQMTEMLMQLAYNQGMDPQQAKEWVSQLNNKIVKGQVTMSDLTQEVKEALTGGAVAVVGANAVDNENIKDNAVSEEKTSFLNVQDNLYNWRSNTDGGRFANDGTWIADVNYSSSDFIKVDAGSYIIGQRDKSAKIDLSRIPMYTNNHDFKGIYNDTTVITLNPTTVTFDSSGYIRLSTLNKNKKELYVTKSDVDSGFQEYTVASEETHKISSEQIDGKISGNNIAIVTQDNYFTDNNATLSGFIERGKIYNNSTTALNYNTTSYIQLPQGTYNFSKYRKLDIYDLNKNFLRLEDNSGTLEKEHTFDTDVYVRVSIDKNEWDSAFIVPTMISVSSEKYTLAPNVRVTNLNLVDSNKKTIAFFGDSITGNYDSPTSIPYHAAKIMGDDFINLAIGGAKMAERDDTSQVTGGGHTANSVIRVIESLIEKDFSNQRAYSEAFYTGTTLSRILGTIDRLETTNFEDVDVAVFFAGMNDYLQGVPIGDFDSGRYTFKGAYKIALEKFQQAYPHIKVVLVSTTITLTQPSSGDLDMNDYTIAVKDIGDYFNYPVVDLYKKSGVNSINRLQYYNSNDSVHPNEKGRELYGRQIGQLIHVFYG